MLYAKVIREIRSLSNKGGEIKITRCDFAKCASQGSEGGTVGML